MTHHFGVDAEGLAKLDGEGIRWWGFIQLYPLEQRKVCEISVQIPNNVCFLIKDESMNISRLMDCFMLFQLLSIWHCFWDNSNTMWISIDCKWFEAEVIQCSTQRLWKVCDLVQRLHFPERSFLFTFGPWCSRYLKTCPVSFASLFFHGGSMNSPCRLPPSHSTFSFEASHFKASLDRWMVR